MTAEATGRTLHRPPSPIDNTRVARGLRRIALHQATAALLGLRVQQATSARHAEPPRRRAAERRELAQQLRAELAAEPATRAAR